MFKAPVQIAPKDHTKYQFINIIGRLEDFFLWEGILLAIYNVIAGSWLQHNTSIMNAYNSEVVDVGIGDNKILGVGFIYLFISFFP